MANVKISQILETSTVGANDLMELAKENSGSYSSASAKISTIGKAINSNVVYSQELNTSNKTIIGAINEIAYKELTGTLEQGDTIITFEDASITSNSTIEPFTSIYGVNPTAVSLGVNSVTLTFDVQQVDMEVKVRVS